MRDVDDDARAVRDDARRRGRGAADVRARANRRAEMSGTVRDARRRDERAFDDVERAMRRRRTRVRPRRARRAASNAGLTRRDARSAPETLERTRETVERDDDDAENAIERSNAWSTTWSTTSSLGGGFGDGEDGTAANAAAAVARALLGGATEGDRGKDFGAIERGMFDAFVAGARAVAAEVSRAADALETRGADDAADGEDDARRIPPRA